MRWIVRDDNVHGRSNLRNVVMFFYFLRFVTVRSLFQKNKNGTQIKQMRFMCENVIPNLEFPVASDYDEIVIFL